MKGKKGLNIKALFTQHIEKIGFGLIGFVVVMIWASEFFGGSWSRTSENPNVMIQDIEKKKKEIDASLWPEEMKQEFELVNFQDRAATLLRPIESSKYELSTEYFVPLNKPKEKAREPDYLAVESLQADYGHVILALMPLPEDPEGEEAAEEEPMKEPGEADEELDEFERRDVATGAGEGAAGVMDDVPAMMGGRARGGSRRQVNAGPGAQPTGGDALVGQAKASSNASGRGGRNYRTTSGQRPKGMFYVAVRGVFPIRQQLEKIQRALHLPTWMAARDHLEILDFQLERQEATAGDNPWTKDWETLNILYAKQVLSEVDGFDDEMFDMRLFDPVITMPLPMRMFGFWKDHGIHPKIKNYVKTPEETKKENEFRARLMEEYEKMHIEEEKARGPKKGGFNDDVHDVRQMVTDMTRNNPRETENTFMSISREMGGARGTAKPGDMTARITAVERLLLFRYFDFDVQPGHAYRYRVKLKLKNPNYERPMSEVVDRSVAEGEARWTPGSKISNAAVLPVSPTYFLKDVEKNPLADHGRIKRTIANVNIYEWHRDLGTQVYSTLSMGSLGQFLGGKSKTMTLDVAQPSMEEEEYTFSTEDMLVDVIGDAELTPEDHPLLNLPKKARGAKVVEVGLATEAIVLGQGGDLRHLEADGESSAEKAMRKQADRERAPYKDLKKVEDTSNPLDMPGAGKGEKGAKNAAGAMGRMGGDAYSSNPLRKGGRGNADAGMDRPGMMLGAGAAGANTSGGKTGKSPPKKKARRMFMGKDKS